MAPTLQLKGLVCRTSQPRKVAPETAISACETQELQPPAPPPNASHLRIGADVHSADRPLGAGRRHQAGQNKEQALHAARLPVDVYLRLERPMIDENEWLLR